MKKIICFHCGEICLEIIEFNKKYFCCNGCLSVYNIIKNSGLEKFYELNKNPGIIPDKKNYNKYYYLDNENICNKIIDFKNEKITILRFFIPTIHCSSCIFLLENLSKINFNILNSIVDFNNKILRITFNNNHYKISDIVHFLNEIGYTPIIKLKFSNQNKYKKNYFLIYKLVISFFCFGNIMLLSLPEYINIKKDIWLLENQNFFRWLMLILSLPVILFCDIDYFKSAYKGIKNQIINIDIPISLGILVLFIRTLYEIIYELGPGYSDSLTGLIFFLLCGKYFQIRTYNYLSFDQDYKSFYPISVTRISKNLEEDVFIYDLKKNDHIIIRNEEIIPVDAILIKGLAAIDNSFITGESTIINKKIGSYIYAGGKQKGGSIELKIAKEIDKSYLSQLWKYGNNNIKYIYINTMINKLSSYFTIIILFLSLFTGIYWYNVNISKMMQSICSVLIVACPCALSLSIPFTFGNIMRILSKNGFFLRNIYVVERSAQVGSLVFDKTGTITNTEDGDINFIGESLTLKQKQNISSLLKNSIHPLSKMLYKKINTGKHNIVTNFEEIPGKGLQGFVDNKYIKIGSEKYVNKNSLKIKNEKEFLHTRIYISIGESILGYFSFRNKYRKNLKLLFKKLSNYKIYILSGDNNFEKNYLKSILPKKSKLFFNKNPYDKINFIKKLQKNGEKIMMFGDGINDSGALKQSEVGVSICNNYAGISLNCDVLLDAKYFEKISDFLILSKKSIKIVKINFIISFLYNIVGLYFAIVGKLTPLISAILMPLSSITVVCIAIIFTWVIAYKKNMNLK